MDVLVTSRTIGLQEMYSRISMSRTISYFFLFHLMEQKSENGNKEVSQRTDRSIDSTVMTTILFLFYY